ncbi:MAG: D-alanyl-D-alanine carboxypeptidase family protein [Oscillospiraceae bacterium]|nr:D-alanyl-D-alanine carboxypeptidase family protein [Oscillospiraceae bacterium]
MRKFTGIVLSLALIFAVKIPARAELAVSAKAAILMHADSGRVLYEKNADEHMLIASTTKIMTAIVVLEHCELDDLVEVDSRSAGIEGSSMYLKAGESYTVEDLLYGLLLVSGNDAASALALHVADSMEEFAELMNAKAAELGMTESSFKNAHGLDEEGHYSTARDMAKLAAYCMGNEDFARIAGTVSHTVGEQTLVNHNRLLREYDGCLGLKTGYTMAAGRTLVTCAERDGARYVCVTLNDPDDWDDHKALYDWAFANYSFAEVIPAGLSYEVPLISGAEMTAPAETEGAAYALIQNGESYDMELELPAFAFAPISEGDRAGRAVACSDGQEIASVRIVYSEDVEVDRELKLTPGERFLRFWVLTGLSAPFYLE